MTPVDALKSAGGRALTAKEIAAVTRSDIGDTRLALELMRTNGVAQFSEQTDRWSLVGEAPTLRSEPQHHAALTCTIPEAIIKVLEEANSAMDVGSIRAALPKVSADSITAALPKMARDGRLCRVRVGWYGIPGPEYVPPPPKPKGPTVGERIVAALHAAGAAMKRQDLADAIDAPVGSVDYELRSLAKKGAIVRPSQGVVALPVHTPSVKDKKINTHEQVEDPADTDPCDPAPDQVHDGISSDVDLELRFLGLQDCIARIEDVLRPLPDGRWPEPGAFETARSRLELLERLAAAEEAGKR